MGMMQNFLFSIILLVLVLGCQKKDSTDKIIIAAASNVQYAMEELVDTFTLSTGIKCEVIISSSGKLTAQIQHGAPYDILISANMKYPEDLHQKQLTLSPPKIYAYGKLVLWTFKNIELSSEILKSSSIKHIALANPQNAPYGSAAMTYLDTLNLTKSMQKKFIYGESISQTNQFVHSQSADIGFTAKSVVLAPKMKGKGKWLELDQRYYPPIRQGAVLMKKNSEVKLNKSKKFFEFLSSDKAKKILQRYGYQTP